MSSSHSDPLKQFYTVATEISLLFAKNQLGDVDRTIIESLGILGRFARVERTYVFTFDYANAVSHYDYEWCDKGIEPQIEHVATVPFEVLSEWIASFRQGRYVYLDSIPAMAESELRNVLMEQSIKSLVAYPMFHGEELLGFVGFDAVREHREWEMHHFALLKIACDTIGSALSSRKYRRELVKAKLEAERGNRIKSEFIARMSHELRSPLNSVIGFSELIDLELKEERYDRLSEYIGIIRSGGQHLLSMINDILDLSRLETDRIHIEKTNIDLRDVVDLVMDLIGLTARMKAVSIEIDKPETPVWLCADLTRMRQVFYNLLSNAIKFTESGKRVGVRLRSERSWIHFEVWDEGRGIPTDSCKRIFEPFQQVEVTDSTELEGSGLGLAIVKSIVDLHDGTVDVTSEVGEGSRFVVRLPVADTEGEGKTQKEGKGRLQSRRGNRDRLEVLCVDDIEANRILVAEGLALANYNVTVASTGREALALCGERVFDIVLLDIVLPDITGFEVRQHLRELYPETPVVAVTASITSDIRKQILESGFDAFHGKPIDLNELIDLLDDLVCAAS